MSTVLHLPVRQWKHSHTLLPGSGVRKTTLLAPIPLRLWRESQGIHTVCPPCQLRGRSRWGMLKIMSHCFQVLRGQNRTENFPNIIIQRRRKRSQNCASVHFISECVEIRKKKKNLFVSLRKLWVKTCKRPSLLVNCPQDEFSHRGKQLKIRYKQTTNKCSYK